MSVNYRALWEAEHGKIPRDEDGRSLRYSSKLTEAQVQEIREKFTEYSVEPMRGSREHAFAKEEHQNYGLSVPAIKNIVTGKSWGASVSWV
jgi:hypothetical protein